MVFHSRMSEAVFLTLESALEILGLSLAEQQALLKNIKERILSLWKNSKNSLSSLIETFRVG